MTDGNNELAKTVDQKGKAAANWEASGNLEPDQAMQLVRYSVGDIMAMAEAIARSRVWGIKNADQAFALMIVSDADGMHPAHAIRKYHIMSDGRASMKAEAVLAEFQNQGGRVRWIQTTDEVCEAEFSHPAGGTYVSRWTIKMAERAGLLKNSSWQKYPEALLTARCITQGVRHVRPAASLGIYTPEELQNIPLSETEAPLPIGIPPGKDIKVKVTNVLADKEMIDLFWKGSEKKGWKGQLTEEQRLKVNSGTATKAEITQIAMAAQEAHKRALAAEKDPEPNDPPKAEKAQQEAPAKAQWTNEAPQTLTPVDGPALTPGEREDLQAAPSDPDDLDAKYDAPEERPPDQKDDQEPPPMSDESGEEAFS